jgi:glycerophosphoryl diester phosphodiesterase
MSEPAREWLIAHRGWPARHPENSIEGIRAALAAGARWVEFDVQLSADACPVVFHDDELSRVTGQAGRITETDLEAIGALRLEGGARIPTLARALAAVTAHPGATAFVELKRHSIRRFGRRRAVGAVCERLREAGCPCVFISFDRRAAGMARARGVDAIGWVVRRRSFVSRWLAAASRPQYLFIRADRVPAGPGRLWPGPWRWAIYGVDTLEQARDWRRRGAGLVEVDDLPGLLEAERRAT